MTDDIVAQLWRVYERGDKDAIRLASYAADEITRLRAERDKLLTQVAEKDAALEKMDGDARCTISDVEHDLTDMRLRAEHAEAERDALRADLAAEREWKRANIELAEQLITVTAERDALRAALQYARNLIGPDEIIDTKLNDGGGDE